MGLDYDTWPGLKCGTWALVASVLAACLIFAATSYENLIPCLQTWQCSNPEPLLAETGPLFLFVTVPVTGNALVLGSMSLTSKLQPGFGVLALLVSLLPLITYALVGLAFYHTVV